MRRPVTALVASLALAAQSFAQELPIKVQQSQAPSLVRPYEGPSVPPIRLNNSDRLHTLIRAGKLYLTVQDAIALAIENSLDLEVNRYGPLIAEWQLDRAQAGGALRGVTSGNSQVGSVTSGQGVAGSQASAGLSSGGSGNNSTSGGAVVSQIGPVTANLDPVLQNTTLFSHITSPQVNTVQSQTTALVDSTHIYNTTLQQGLLSGGYVQARFNEQYLKENTPTDILNPSVAPRAVIYVQHNFLSGFGVGVNSRFIRVAQRNAVAAKDTFRSQVLDLVANVLNQYWGLVSAGDALRAKQHALDVSQKFFEDTRDEIRLGALSGADIYRAQAEVGTRKQELSIAQSNVRQQENLLKNVLSRNGMQDALLDACEIVPLDVIQVPTNDDLPPLRELVAKALAQRPDVAVSNIRDETAEISALGTANGIRPQLQGFAQTYNTGLSGTSQPYQGVAPNPYFIGGFGNALGQVVRRNFPNTSGGAVIQARVGNRISQGDYGIDQLQLRQGDLTTRRDRNQIVVDVSNQVVALRQARARYGAAVDSRTLQEQLLDREQQSFRIGGATFNDLIVAQRNLVTAQTAEVTALAAYARARVGLDQVLGQTLETNNVSIDDALSGRVARQSAPPPAK